MKVDSRYIRSWMIVIMDDLFNQSMKGILELSNKTDHVIHQNN